MTTEITRAESGHIDALCVVPESSGGEGTGCCTAVATAEFFARSPGARREVECLPGWSRAGLDSRDGIYRYIRRQCGPNVEVPWWGMSKDSADSIYGELGLDYQKARGAPPADCVLHLRFAHEDSGEHVVALVGGVLYDTWDCRTGGEHGQPRIAGWWAISETLEEEFGA